MQCSIYEMLIVSLLMIYFNFISFYLINAGNCNLQIVKISQFFARKFVTVNAFEVLLVVRCNNIRYFL